MCNITNFERFTSFFTFVSNSKSSYHNPIKLYIRRKVIKCRYSLCTFWSHIQGCTKIIQGVTKQNSSKNMLTLLDHPVLMEHFHHFVIKQLNSTKYKLSENVLVLIVNWFCNAYSGCAKNVFFFHHNSCKCQSSHTYLYILYEKFGEKITLKCPVLKFYKVPVHNNILQHNDMIIQGVQSVRQL